MEARIADLEAQLREAQAQAHATAINSEHAGQAMERRYTALAEDQGKLAAEKEKLLAENAELVQDLQAAKTENNKLQASVFEKDAIIQRKDVEIEALHSDKRTLAKLLQQREAELDEAHRRHQQSLDKIVVLSNTNATLDAEAHEARAAKNRLQQELLKEQQHVEVLKSHTKWLEDEVASKIEAAQQERRTVSAQVVQLQQTITEAEDKVQQLELSERRLRERVAELQRSAETCQQSLKVAKDEADSKEHIFSKELATAQKLYTLYKDASEERSRKVMELEGIIRELQKHLEEAEAAQRDVVDRAEARATAAEQEAAAEREQRHRVMEAAANGNLPLVSSPGDAPMSPNGESFSHTELYMKYVEATTQCRQERLAKRQIEIMLEQVMGEIEAKSELVREQDREYSRVQEAHEQMSANLAIAASENRQHTARINQLEAEARRDANNRRMLEQQVRDLGQQVTVLLNQVQMLQNGRAGRPAAGSSATIPSSSSALITSSDIISERLLSFPDIQGLQLKNIELLTVVRQLSAEKDQERASIEQEIAKGREAVEAEKDALYAERAKQQELFEQVVRQRDMFKKLFQDASGTHGSQQADGTRLLLPPPGASAPDSNGNTQNEPDYKAMHHDLEKELEHVRKEGEEHRRLLNEESAKAKEAASAARAEAARMRNEAEFERERSQRLQEQLRDLHKQVEALTQSNTKYQVLVIELQQRHSNLDAELGAQRDKARQLEARVNFLENEKALLTAAEQRLIHMVEGLSMEKHKLAAQLQVEQKGSAEKEAEYVSERKCLTEEVARLQQDLVLAQKTSAEVERHLKNAALESQAAAERAENKAKAIEESTQQLRNEATQSQQRASSAEVKVEVLQKAVQQAEERVATLEMQMQSRSGLLEDDPGTSGSQAPAGSREADLANQIKHLREELTSAQETAAAATGHAKQYEMLAKSSDEAVKVMQGQLEKCKQEYEERISAIKKEAEDLQGQVAELEKGKTEAQQHLQAVEKTVEDANRQAASREAELKAQLSDADKDMQQLRTRVHRQSEDIEQLRSQCRAIQKNYDHQVVEHAGAVNKLNAVEVALKAASEKVRQQQEIVTQAQRQKEDAEAELKRQQLLLEQKVQDAEGKVREFEDQNRLLHTQLAKMAEQRASMEGGDGELAQIVGHLRKQQDILSAELDLAQQESARLRNDLSVARRLADAASAQMASQTDRARQSARTEEEHAALMQKVEQLNWLRDSNNKLRADSDRMGQEVAKLRQRAEHAERAAEPLDRRIRDLSAQVESHNEEMRVANENAQQWEKRAQQLQQKYGKVDLAEHQRVQEKLAKAEAELAKHRSTTDSSTRTLRAELEKVKADLDRARKQEKAAKAQIFGTFNPEKLPLFDWKVAQANMKQRLAQLEEAATEAAQVREEVEKLRTDNADLKKELARVQKELSDKTNEAEDAKSDLKIREGKQLQEKQQSIKAVQSERRRQAEEKASLQSALDTAKTSAAAAEDRVRSLEQTIAQLQSEVNTGKDKTIALEKDLAACRAEQQSKTGAQDGEPVSGLASEPEAAEAPVVDADMHVTEAEPAPAVSAQHPTEQAPPPMLVPVAEAIMPSSPPAPVRPAVPSLPAAAELAPAIPDSGALSLQDQLRARLLAKRGISPVPEAAKPSSGSSEEDRKREAPAVEPPLCKRPRTTSEDNTAAQAQAESFLASLEEPSAATSTPTEVAEPYVEDQGGEEQQQEEYEGEYEAEEDEEAEAEAAAEEHGDEGEDQVAQRTAAEQQDAAAQDADGDDMLEDDAKVEADRHHADAEMKGDDELEETDAQGVDQAENAPAGELATASEPTAPQEEPAEKATQVEVPVTVEAGEVAPQHGAADESEGAATPADEPAQVEEVDTGKEAEKLREPVSEEPTAQPDGATERPFRKKARIEWKKEAPAQTAGPGALSAAALPFSPGPGRGAAPGRVLMPGRGGPGRVQHPSTLGRGIARGGGLALAEQRAARGGRIRGRGTAVRGRRQPGVPEGQPPPAGGQQ
ncbi:g6735 [Coccomyxa elongata]